MLNHANKNEIRVKVEDYKNMDIQIVRIVRSPTALVTQGKYYPLPVYDLIWYDIYHGAL